MARQHFGDTALGVQIQRLARVIGGVDGTRLQARAAMDTFDDALFRQLIEIAAHRLGRDVEVSGELFDRGIALPLDQLDDGFVTFLLCHGGFLPRSVDDSVTDPSRQFIKAVGLAVVSVGRIGAFMATTMV